MEKTLFDAILSKANTVSKSKRAVYSTMIERHYECSNDQAKEQIDKIFGNLTGGTTLGHLIACLNDPTDDIESNDAEDAHLKSKNSDMEKVLAEVRQKFKGKKVIHVQNKVSKTTPTFIVIIDTNKLKITGIMSQCISYGRYIVWKDGKYLFEEVVQNYK